MKETVSVFFSEHSVCISVLLTLWSGVRQREVLSSTDMTSSRQNIWLERREFYNSAVPRDTDEEEKMLQAALELSRREHSDRSAPLVQWWAGGRSHH